MSTKIYDAYEYKGDLGGLMKTLGKIRKRVKANGLKLLVGNIDDRVKFNWINYAEALKKSFRSSAYHIEDKEFGAILNVAASAVVYTYKGRLFVQFFGLPNNIKLGSKKLVDYHYQNQSDPWYAFTPRAKDKVWCRAQEKNYRERRRVWESIFTDNAWRPNSAGLVFEFLSADDANEMSVKVWEKLHNHKMDGSFNTTCAMCVTGRAAYDVEQAKIAAGVDLDEKL